MPELPDLTVYLEALDARIVGQRLERLLIRSPFLLRTAEPPIESAQARRVTEGKSGPPRFVPGGPLFCPPRYMRLGKFWPYGC